MEERMMNCLNRIEGHLAIIAEAAAAKVKRAESTKRTEAKKRLITPEDKPLDEHIELARKLGVDLYIEWPKFKNYCQANAVRYASFNAALRKWILEAHNRTPRWRKP